MDKSIATHIKIHVGKPVITHIENSSFGYQGYVRKGKRSTLAPGLWDYTGALYNQTVLCPG